MSFFSQTGPKTKKCRKGVFFIEADCKNISVKWADITGSLYAQSVEVLRLRIYSMWVSPNMVGT